MSFTVRNSNFQVGQAFFATDLEILATMMQGAGGVLTGMEVTAQGPPDMTVHMSAGCFSIGTATLWPMAADDYAITAAATEPRIDLIAADNTGAVSITDGIPNAAPEPPALPIVDDVYVVALAYVYVRAGTTEILAGDLIDKRAVIGLRRTIGTDGDGGTPNLQAIGLGPRLELLSTRGPLAAPTDCLVDDPVGVIRFKAVNGGSGALETTLTMLDTVKSTAPLRTLTTLTLTELSLVQTWSDAGHLFTGLALDADPVASLAGSLLLKLSLSGSAKATIDTAGHLILTGGITCTLPTAAGATGTLWNDSGTVKVS